MKRNLLYVLAVVGLLVACAVTTALSVAQVRGDARDAREELADRAVSRLRLVIGTTEESLIGVRAFLQASPGADAAAFATFTTPLLRQPELEGIGYAARVPGARRGKWERRHGLRVREAGGRGLVSAARRDMHAPVLLVRQRSAGRPPLGFDLASEGTRARALEDATTTGGARATAPVRLAGTERPGVVLLLPVYRGTTAPRTAAERRARLRGWVAGGLHVSELSGAVLRDLPPGTRIRVRDRSQVLAGPASPMPEATGRVVGIAGRAWTVEVAGGPGVAWASPLGVAGAGLAVTALIALLFRQAARREAYAFDLVAARLRERDAAESRLRASEEAFRLLAEGSTDMVSLHWPDGRYVYVSPSSEELVGYLPQELAGRSPREYLHPEDLARLEREAPDADDEAVVTTTFRFRHKAGHYTWLEATERLIRNAAGEVVEVRAAARCADERVRAETALRERESRISSLVQSVSDAIVVADGDGRIVSWNEAATRIFGHSAEDAIGRSLGIIMPERYRGPHERALAAATAGGATRLVGHVLELVGLRADGTEFPLELTLGAWQSEGDRFFAGVIRDVSARKAEDAERQKQERFRAALLGSLSEGVAACDGEGRLLFFNEARRRLHSWVEEPTTVEEWARTRTLFLPDGVTPLTADRMPLARVLAGEVVREEQVELIVGDIRRTLLVTGQPILDDEGHAIGAVTAAHDITERRQTQARLERTTRQLESILDAVGEGVYGLDEEGRVTFANPAAAAMLGWEIDELLGQSQDGLGHPSGHDGRPPEERSQIWRVLEDGEARRVEDELFWRRDGRCFPVAYVTSPLRDGGRPVGAVVTFQDISERRAVERMKDEFVSMVSHELRTPLTSIRGALGILSDGGDLPPAAERRMLEIACANTERLVRLINDILDLERIGSGEEALAIGSWCARGLAEDAVALIAPLAAEHRVRITGVAPEAALAVDPDRIIQVLTNLLGNAIKFSPPDGCVTVGGRVGGDEVVLSVADEGRGIPPDKLEAIFERFQQVDASDARQAGGTGLGLAICRRITTLHGGRVWAENRPGGGSVFLLALPLSPEPADERTLPFLGAAI